MKVKRIGVANVAAKQVFPKLPHEYQSLVEVDEKVVAYAVGLVPDEVREFKVSENRDRLTFWVALHRLVSAMKRCGHAGILDIPVKEVLSKRNLRRLAGFR